jgi:hypothetical protein
MTGSATQTPPAVIEVGESPRQSFRARLGAKVKSMLEWMWERLSFFLQQ